MPWVLWELFSKRKSLVCGSIYLRTTCQQFLWMSSSARSVLDTNLLLRCLLYLLVGISTLSLLVTKYGQACVILTLPLPLHLPLHYIWNLVEYMYSDPSLMCLVVYPENLEIQENSVTKNLQMNVIGWLMAAPQVNPEITGLKYSKMSALEKLCLELKAAVTIRKEQSCNKSSKYFVKKVYVEGNLLHCSQENSGTHDRLQDPQRIGRHKFNLG
ncbi:uncharacterized protein LOC135097873 isoform X7 [Scylla paramamosain]|uniref:uncharacterized protein LOC135097873 isoform X7 n=1 Tax=Scylla paramamosain TaxID=85552 RepID=UPI003083612C